MAQDIVIANGMHARIIEGGRAYLNSLDLRLYAVSLVLSGSVMPVVGTDEPDDTGYQAVAPLGPPFPNAFVDLTGSAKSSGYNPTVVFTNDPGGETIYGAFFTDPADSDATVMAVEMDTPFPVTAAGQVIVPQSAFSFRTWA